MLTEKHALFKATDLLCVVALYDPTLLIHYYHYHARQHEMQSEKSLNEETELVVSQKLLRLFAETVETSRFLGLLFSKTLLEAHDEDVTAKHLAIWEALAITRLGNSPFPLYAALHVKSSAHLSFLIISMCLNPDAALFVPARHRLSTSDALAIALYEACQPEIKASTPVRAAINANMYDLLSLMLVQKSQESLKSAFLYALTRSAGCTSGLLAAHDSLRLMLTSKHLQMAINSGQKATVALLQTHYGLSCKNEHKMQSSPTRKPKSPVAVVFRKKFQAASVNRRLFSRD